MEKKLVWWRDYRQNRCICTLRTRETDLFANLLKLSRFFSLLRIFKATIFDAVPIGVAIPPIPVPTAKAQAKGAIETPEKLDIAPITGMKTVTSGTLSTIWLISAVVQRTSVTASARFPPDS